MPAISPDMRKAALSGKDPGRPHVLNTVEDERNTSIMTHPTATAVSDQERQEIARLTDHWYREALAILGTVVQARTMAGLPLPPEPPRLFTLSIPHQVSR